MGAWLPDRLPCILLQGRCQNELPRICSAIVETVVENRLFSLVVLPLADLDRFLSLILLGLLHGLGRSLVAALRDEVLDPLEVRVHGIR